MRIILGLVVVAAFALAGPASTATLDQPVAGATYTYKKVLPKWPGWGSAIAPFNIVSVEVGSQGGTIRVGWSLYTGHDCTGLAYGRKLGPHQTPDGSIVEKILVKPDGSFHGARRNTGRGVKYDVAEVRGQFVDQGRAVRVSVRHHSYASLSSSNWARCAGKWLTFRLPLSDD